MLIYLGVLLMVNALAHQGVVAQQAVYIADNDPGGSLPAAHTAMAPTEPSTDLRWGLARIQASEACRAAEGYQPVTVAVLDTGIAEDSTRLAGMVVARVNYTDSPTTDDLYRHGTHMAGTIAAVAPDCRLMNIKVADDAGQCRPEVVARGIRAAVYHGAKVVNVSLCMKPSPELEEAVDYAWAQGALVLGAAGNQGTSNPLYPACYPTCIAVTGTDRNDSLAPLSNSGGWVDMAAPGYSIYAELPGGEYGFKSGTSSAAAHVSGVAALAFSVAHDLNGNCRINDEVRRAIDESCSPLPIDGTGQGLINALTAVTLALVPA